MGCLFLACGGNDDIDIKFGSVLKGIFVSPYPVVALGNAHSDSRV